MPRHRWAVALSITLALSLGACGASTDPTRAPTNTPAVVQSPSPAPRADPTAWDLRGFDDVVEQDRDWFASIGVTFKSVARGSLYNPQGIDLSFKGPVAAADAIEAHYGNPPWLRVVWSGPGEWKGPLGDLDVYTADAAGRPVPMVDIEIAAVDIYQVDADPGYGVGTDEKGYLRRKGIPAVAYLVRAFKRVADYQVAVAEARVTVPANGRATVRLIIK